MTSALILADTRDTLMKKFCPLLCTFVLVLFFFFFADKASAGTFQLKTIGSISVNGANYKQWWYTTTPALTGSALNNASVQITIDSTSSTVTAGSDGGWTYTPPTLSSGDHKVSLVSGGSTISFTLTIGGSVPANVGAPPANQTPVAGNITPLISLIFIGGTLLTLGKKLRSV